MREMPADTNRVGFSPPISGTIRKAPMIQGPFSTVADAYLTALSAALESAHWHEVRSIPPQSRHMGDEQFVWRSVPMMNASRIVTTAALIALIGEGQGAALSQTV